MKKKEREKGSRIQDLCGSMEILPAPSRNNYQFRKLQENSRLEGGKGGGSGEGGRMERAVNVFHGKQRESLEEIEPECKDLNAMENWFLVRQITGFVVQTTRVRGLYWIW